MNKTDEIAGKYEPRENTSEEEIERRFIPISGAELRAETYGDKPTILGYAARFNIWDGEEDMFWEKIEPGAFSVSIASDDVRCLFNHESSELLGRKSNQSLRLWEDNLGLWMECDINPDDPLAMSTFAKVKRRDVTGQSFSFRTPKDAWEFEDGETPRRTLVEISLRDVGPVTFPFYEVTSVDIAFRSLTKAREGLKLDNDHGLDKLTHALRLQEKRRHDMYFKNLKGGK